MNPSKARRDSGESLLEVMMAVAILGIAVVAIVGAISTLIIGGDIHRQQSTATTVLLSAAETVKGPGTAYVACATPAESTYNAALADTSKVTRPADWAAPVITSVTYWNGTTFQGTCFDTAALGNLLRLQQVTISVKDPKNRTTESLSVVKRSSP